MKTKCPAGLNIYCKLKFKFLPILWILITEPNVSVVSMSWVIFCPFKLDD